MKAWRLGRWLLIPAAVLLLVEAGLRLLVGWQAGIIAPDAPDLRRLHQRDVFGWTLLPDLRDAPLETFTVGAGRSVLPRATTVNTNAMGLRMPPEMVDRQAVTVLALGDSTTFGLGVNDGEAWPAQLTGLLPQTVAGQRVQVLNAGVSGWSVVQMWRRLRELEEFVNPHVVVVTAGANDQDATDGISDLAKFDAFHHAVHPERLPYCYLLPRLLAASLGREDRTARVPLNEFEISLRGLAGVAEKNAARLIFVLWPDKRMLQEGSSGMSDYHNVMRRVGGQVGAAVVDLAPVFRPHPKRIFDTIHADAEGCRMAAEAIAPAVGAALEDVRR